MVHLDYRDSRPIYTQIIDGIREQIITGVLQPGDKLPSVRELASTLAINPNTIQRAYRQLEMAGGGGLDRHSAGEGLLRLRQHQGPGAGMGTLVQRVRRGRGGADDPGSYPGAAAAAAFGRRKDKCLK